MDPAISSISPYGDWKLLAALNFLYTLHYGYGPYVQPRICRYVMCSISAAMSAANYLTRTVAQHMRLRPGHGAGGRRRPCCETQPPRVTRTIAPRTRMQPRSTQATTHAMPAGAAAAAPMHLACTVAARRACCRPTPRCAHLDSGEQPARQLRDPKAGSFSQALVA